MSIAAIGILIVGGITTVLCFGLAIHEFIDSRRNKRK